MTPQRSNGDDDPQAMPHTYWDDLAASQKTVVEAIEQVEGEDDWTIHAVVLSGESSTGYFACVVRSKVGDSGLLLSERMVRIPKEGFDGPDDLDMLDNRIMRRVSGPLAQALTKAYARTTNDRLAADDLEADPVALSAIGEEVEHDPEELGPIADDPHEEIRESKTEYVECIECGEEVAKSEAINIGGALGVDQWVHRGACEDGGGE